MKGPSLLLALIYILSCASARGDDGPRVTDVQEPSKVTFTSKKDIDFFPLPIYGNDPNEGGTYGLISVFLFVDHDTRITRQIIAPSLTWNAYIGPTVTGRYIYYPEPDKTFLLSVTGSARHNWGIYSIYTNRPKGSGFWTDDVFLQGRRSIFYQFFGLGNDSQASNQTSFTRLKGELSYRRGYSLTPEFNLGIKTDIQRNFLLPEGAPGQALIQDVFPDVPGVSNGAAMLSEAISLRYDSRNSGENSERGFYSEVSAGPVQSLGGMEGFNRIDWEARALLPESPHFVTALRAFWGYETGASTPFYYQESLGGALLLRGFNDDRFIDQGAWEADIEQRITLFQTHILGVTADWRIDPFLSFGEVYRDIGDFFRSPHVGGGVGFRVWIRPNVTGRVDIATGGEGPKFYVELGIPF